MVISMRKSINRTSYFTKMTGIMMIYDMKYCYKRIILGNINEKPYLSKP